MNLAPPDNTPVAQREGVKKTVGFTVGHINWGANALSRPPST